jgi:hypothetical protein
VRIDCIYVSGWRDDLRFTECCVASIRHWYPHIRICLIKDELAGPYDTTVLERTFGLEVFPSSPPWYGWGAAKLEPLFLPHLERSLILDSDIVFAGPVLDHLERYDEDFIVAAADHEPGEMTENYFDPRDVERLHPGFRFPGYVFNTGQFVATSGILQRADFEPYLTFERPPRFLRPDLFKCGEQGLLNFILMATHQAGGLTLRRAPFMRWPPCMKPEEVDVTRLGPDSPYDFLLHWAGLKNYSFETAPMSHVILHFQRIYRRRAFWWRLRRRLLWKV